MNSTNTVVVLPDSGLTNLEPIQNSKIQFISTRKDFGLSEKRIKQLMGFNSYRDVQIFDPYSLCIEDTLEVIKGNKTIKLIKIGDLMNLLEFLDSLTLEWHINRGLPVDCQGNIDIIVITSKFKETKNYRQEYHVYGMNKNG